VFLNYLDQMFASDSNPFDHNLESCCRSYNEYVDGCANESVLNRAIGHKCFRQVYLSRNIQRILDPYLNNLHIYRDLYTLLQP